MSEAAKKQDSYETQAKELVGYATTVTVDTGNGSQIQIVGSIKKGATAEEMNKELDKLRSVTNRQQAKSVVTAIEQKILKLQKQEALMVEDLERVDDMYAKKGGPSSQERAQRELAASNLKKTREDIAFEQAYLEKIKKEAE